MTVVFPKIQIQGGVKAILLGMVVSLLLAGIKLFTGVVGHSYALVADGLESSTDIVSSFIVVLGITYASRPADKEHPFGHGRVETLIAFVTILFLLGTAVIIAVQSIKNIMNPHEAPAGYTLIVLGVVILIKEGMYRYFKKQNQGVNSTALATEAEHHRSDAISSMSAFVGVGVALIMGKGFESADDWAALVAAGVIMYNCYRISKPAFSELMDEQNHPQLFNQIAELAQSIAGVEDTEKIFIRKNGMNFLVDLHLEVDGEMSVRDSHIIAHLVEEKLINSDLKIIYVALHVEPHDNVIRKPQYLK